MHALPAAAKTPAPAASSGSVATKNATTKATTKGAVPQASGLSILLSGLGKTLSGTVDGLGKTVSGTLGGVGKTVNSTTQALGTVLTDLLGPTSKPTPPVTPPVSPSPPASVTPTSPASSASQPVAPNAPTTAAARPAPSLGRAPVDGPSLIGSSPAPTTSHPTSKSIGDGHRLVTTLLASISTVSLVLMTLVLAAGVAALVFGAGRRGRRAA
ncbi:hypothetical protein [Jatrophihabitans sp.]|uniref:hypothetical protein n=1 Tax=Jatrophihabitans sp. TaxID=1932789 RepID=UPI0030C70ED4